MKHVLDVSAVTAKNICELGAGFEGSNPAGDHLSFTNYYMQLNNKPFFGVSGEFHFSRYPAQEWEDELIKMKVGGINIVATYIFWIHHEEEEGVFDFTGSRDLRRFVALCHKQGLYVIVRIGPFDHGEVRNGGLPDWLYGKPFEVRTTQEGFLQCAIKLYQEIHKQIDGLYFKQSGPIIAAQIDNEYMHSAAPWEITTGVSNEWISHGNEGNGYMLKMLEAAKETGIDVPFYTCTGWGGAATPPEMMPLWGGYAFRPWIFYSHKGEHPATEEYIYRDNHNNAVPSTYNFEPFYQPESKPYLCCEMGGGMTCCYYYRFQLPFESVDAMANIKMGSGCNMLGYYMYHGGTNPKGKCTPFLNEGQVPKLSYDYQAPLGEFGQVRSSYHRLRMLHYLTDGFADVLCRAKTVLPEGSQEITPKDTKTLRYAARITPEGQGFLFINNYQDHAAMHDQKDESILLKLPGQELLMDGLSLAAGENCVLPFNVDVAGIPLKYALAQYITHFTQDGETCAFFMIPEGMQPRYAFKKGTEVVQKDETVQVQGETVIPAREISSRFVVACQGKKLTIITLTRKQSMDFYMLSMPEGKVAVLTKATPLASNGTLRLEHDCPEVSLKVFPINALGAQLGAPAADDGLFASYTLSQEALSVDVGIQQVGPSRYTLSIPELPPKAKQVILEMHYQGDIGSAFIDGNMISDNFANGAAWEIGLKTHSEQLKQSPLTVYIAPVREGSAVNVESVMAGRKEEIVAVTAALDGTSVKIIYEWTL